MKEELMLITECWAGDRNLRSLCFNHLTVIHIKSAVDQLKGADTQLIACNGVFKKIGSV